MSKLERRGVPALVLFLASGLVGACTGQVGSLGDNSGESSGGGGTAGDTGFPTDAIGGGDGGAGDTSNPWADSDKDGYLDRFDNCPTKSNPKQKDADGDGVGDTCDNFKKCANKDQKEGPCKGKGGYDHDRDSDGDGVPDVKDNCDETPNKKQTDKDSDGVGLACETSPDEKFGSGNDSDGDGLSDKKENKMGTNPNKADTDGDGISDGVEVAVGTDPKTAGKACVKKEKEASFVQKPIDVIFSIDTSGSMSQEINAVESNINNNFHNIIKSVDYRVIMLANQREVCIQAPLGGGCGNTMRFKHHDTGYSSQVGEKPFDMFLSNYSTYQKWLRPNSYKVLVIISDEPEQTYTGSFSKSISQGKQDAKKFDMNLRAKSSMDFGTKSDRNYRVHSIVGVPPNSNTPWKPSQPIQNSGCNNGGNSATPAPASEAIATMTGGFRYAVCNTGDYKPIFKKIAKGIVKLSKIGCKLKLPKPSSGKSLDKDKVGLEWKPKKASSATTLTKVHDKSNCGKEHFFINKNGRVQLCSAICKTVKNTKNGTLTVHGGCTKCKKSEEICDYKDNDCDGDVDENCSGCSPELCTDDKDNDCDGKVNEGCCMKKNDGEKCSKDKECCSGNCRPDGTCGPPCRPTGTSCVSNSQCCSSLCAGNSGGSLGSCQSK